MARYFATAFFEQRGQGWSETYYRDANGVTDLAALADFDRNNIWLKRALCLGENGVIKAQRVSFDDVLGDSVLNYITLRGSAGIKSEDPNTALLVRLGNVPNTRRKNVFMRGIPDDLVIDGGEVNGGNVLFNAAANSFFSAIEQNSYGWKGSAVKTDMPVTNYTFDELNRVVFTLGAGSLPAQPVGTKIVVRGKGLGPAGQSALNTSLPCVYTEVANTLRTVKPRAAFAFSGPGGFLTRRTYDLIVAANHRFQKIDSRKAGKASYLQAGRARAKPLG